MIKKIFILLFIPIIIFSQEDEEKNSSFLFSVDYAYQFPELDLKERFGHNSSIGGSLIQKTKTNFLISLSGRWIFGNDIREDNIFDFIDGNNGDIINIDGQIPIIRLFERGAQFHLNIGKKIDLNIKKSKSGIVPSFGLGYVYHKIFIETLLGEIPQLSEDLKKGYDRLSGGFSLKQSITFMYLSENNMKNFNIGLELIECWANDLRNHHYTNNTIPKKRLDLFIGLKFEWIVPLKKRTTSNYYYY
tara:strand:+ start:1537 stop:2274 length:738 start_codon:yes stop_codon:yes gene_type:complete